MNEELTSMLETMDIPKLRRADVRWLWRNVPSRNANHPLFVEVMELLKEELKSV